MQKIKNMKAKLKKRFEVADVLEGNIPIGFKFSDGRKVEFSFSSNSTIKVYINVYVAISFTKVIVYFFFSSRICISLFS